MPFIPQRASDYWLCHVMVVDCTVHVDSTVQCHVDCTVHVDSTVHVDNTVHVDSTVHVDNTVHVDITYTQVPNPIVLSTTSHNMVFCSIITPVLLFASNWFVLLPLSPWGIVRHTAAYWGFYILQWKGYNLQDGYVQDGHNTPRFEC